MSPPIDSNHDRPTESRPGAQEDRKRNTQHCPIGRAQFLTKETLASSSGLRAGAPSRQSRSRGDGTILIEDHFKEIAVYVALAIEAAAVFVVAFGALQALSGVGLPPLLTACFLAADRLAPPGTAVEAFAWIFTAFTVGSATGAAIAGPLADTSIRAGFAFAPLAGLLAVAAMAVVP